MLRLISILLICGFTISDFAQAKYQFSQGKWELGLSGSVGSLKMESEYKSSLSSSIKTNSDSRTFFQLNVTPAYFVMEGLSVEPEIDFLLMEGGKPAYLFLGNVSYSMFLENSFLAPFVRAGYGISNSVVFPFQPGFINRVSNKLDVPILNLGAGLKLAVTENVLIRTELNYRSLSYKTNYLSYNTISNYKYTYSFITMLFGFSVLL